MRSARKQLILRMVEDHTEDYCYVYSLTLLAVNGLLKSFGTHKSTGDSHIEAQGMLPPCTEGSDAKQFGLQLYRSAVPQSVHTGLSPYRSEPFAPMGFL